MKCKICGKDSANGHLVQTIFNECYCVDCAFDVANTEEKDDQEES